LNNNSRKSKSTIINDEPNDYEVDTQSNTMSAGIKASYAMSLVSTLIYHP